MPDALKELAGRVEKSIKAAEDDWMSFAAVDIADLRTIHTVLSVLPPATGGEEALCARAVPPQEHPPGQGLAAEPFVLVWADDPERKPILYGCRKCGRVNSPAIYLAKPEVAHAAAKQAATDCYDCREHNTCTKCSAQCEKGWTACPPCRRQSAIDRATLVEASSLEECFGLDGGEFYSSPEDAADAGEEYVYASTFRIFHLDPCSVIERVLDDHHEDADENDLYGAAELRAAVEAFNAKQKSGSWDEDRTRVACVAKPSAVSEREGDGARPKSFSPPPTGEASPDVPPADAFGDMLTELGAKVVTVKASPPEPGREAVLKTVRDAMLAPYRPGETTNRSEFIADAVLTLFQGGRDG